MTTRVYVNLLEGKWFKLLKHTNKMDLISKNIGV
jgi:hypothetical protein